MRRGGTSVYVGENRGDFPVWATIGRPESAHEHIRECIRSHGRPMVAPTAHEYRLHLDESIRNVGATIGRPENAGEYRLRLDESIRNVGATIGRPESASEYVNDPPRNFETATPAKECCDKEYAKRKSNRLQEWDYTQNGQYFITICTKDRVKIFWEAKREKARTEEIYDLSRQGMVAEHAIRNIPMLYGDNVKVEKYVVMPNHVHLILTLNDDGKQQKAKPSVSVIVNQLKGAVSKQIGYSVWQKSFYDHIIRDEDDYLNVWEYIDSNPLKWNLDCYYEEGK